MGAKRQQREQRGPSLESVFIAVPPTLGPDSCTAECRSKIEQVVPHHLVCAGIHERVEGILSLRIDVIDPGGKHAQSSELAAMFMRHDVVGVVGSGAVILKWTEWLTLHPQAGQHPIGTVRIPRDVLQHVIDICDGHRAFLPVRSHERRAVTDHQILAARRGNVVFRYPVVEREQQLRRYYFRPACHFGMSRGIELGEEEPARVILQTQPRCDSVTFAGNHGPRTGGGDRQSVRSSCDIGIGKTPPANPIGKPIGVRHLVDRIHIHRPPRGAVAGAADGLPAGHRVVDVCRSHVRRVPVVDLMLQRIVGIELLHGRFWPHAERGQRQHEGHVTSPECARHDRVSFPTYRHRVRSVPAMARRALRCGASHQAVRSGVRSPACPRVPSRCRCARWI